MRGRGRRGRRGVHGRRGWRGGHSGVQEEIVLCVGAEAAGPKEGEAAMGGDAGRQNLDLDLHASGTGWGWLGFGARDGKADAVVLAGCRWRWSRGLEGCGVGVGAGVEAASGLRAVASCLLFGQGHFCLFAWLEWEKHRILL